MKGCNVSSHDSLCLQDEHVGSNIDVHEIARHCSGLSGADLAEVARQAALIPVKEYIKQEREMMRKYGGQSRGVSASEETTSAACLEDVCCTSFCFFFMG